MAFDIVFLDRSRPPREDDLAAALGRAAPAWRELRARVEKSCAPVAADWFFTSRASGWGLRLKHGKRVLLYLSPREGGFLASFALGEKAVAATAAVKLPAAVRAAIASAPRYPEGRGVRLEVRTRTLVAGIARAVEVKHAH